MEIRTLDQVSFNDVFHAYQETFSDSHHLVEKDLSSAQLRWGMAGVDFHLSYGAFEENRLVAFMLNSEIDGTLFHFAMGVVPDYRGHRLLDKIFSRIPKGFRSYRLQVMKENIPAFKIYEKQGLHISRELVTFEGVMRLSQPHQDVLYTVKPFYLNPDFETITLMKPSFESETTVLQKTKALHETHEIRSKECLLAYAHFTPAGLMLREVGARESLSENLDCLFYHMKLHGEWIRVLDIDREAGELIQYFISRGLKEITSQFEMIRSS